MKHFISILLAAILCATASAQTIRTLGFNTTNGQIVASTNVVWTNAFSFSTNSVAAAVRTNLSLGLPALTNTSNVTLMRALAGSTNTNEPITTSINFLGHNNETFVMEVVNGIITKVYEQ